MFLSNFSISKPVATVVLVIGLMHAHLVWPGDILVLYAVCGMIVFPLRRIAAVPLIAIGLMTIAVGSTIWGLFGWSVQFWPPEAVAGIVSEDWKPPVENLQREIAIYQGGWLTQMQERVPAALAFETIDTLVWGLWRAGGLMLQVTPEARDVADDWERLSLLMKTAEDLELVDTSLAPETLLWRLFHEDEVRVHPPEPVIFRCECDGERIARILKGYTPEEREGLADPDGIIRASCEFCGTVHQITPAALI